MRYIKTFEGSTYDRLNKRYKEGKSLKDKIKKSFLLNTYWIFTNSMQHSIFKVIERNKTKVEFDIFLITKEGKPHNQFFNLGFTYEDVNSFLEGDGKGEVVFRKATEEEIELFELSKETTKYNI